MNWSLVALLTATAVGYMWDLSASGWANSFYSAAVQAGTKSWKAFFFGSLDSSNFITVDKPPGSLWLMELSTRIFGFSSWSMLVPEALAGVATVALVYLTVRRWFGVPAGLIAGAVMASTPVAALMFRYNNPDALLVLLLVASAYTLTRALEKAGTRWIVATGVLIGFAFLVKMLQAFTVLPAFGAVYLLAAPTGLRRRVAQLVAGAVAIFVSAGWWVAIVALWPAASRPMIDGSTDNSILNLIVGYNGLGRLYSSDSGAGGGSGAGGNFGGATGLFRMFNSLMGGQASWLLPAALAVAVAGVAWRGRAARTDRTRSAVLLWGGWLVVTAAVFSFSQGIIHTYYTVALAPAIAALTGIGTALLWSQRHHLAARLAGAATVVGSGVWAYALLDRTPSYYPWLRDVIAVSAVVGAAAILGMAPSVRRAKKLSAVAAVASLVACLSGSLAYAATTVTTVHTGGLPSAGPAVKTAVSVGGPYPGPGSASGSAPGGIDTTVSAALTAALRSHAASYKWVAAVNGSMSAAPLELASGDAVMAIGGFSNQGGDLGLATFERYVAEGDIHYYIAGSGGTFAGPGGGSATSKITSWVAAHYSAEKIGGQTVYDLTVPK